MRGQQSIKSSNKNR